MVQRFQNRLGTGMTMIESDDQSRRGLDVEYTSELYPPLAALDDYARVMKNLYSEAAYIDVSNPTELIRSTIQSLAV